MATETDALTAATAQLAPLAGSSVRGLGDDDLLAFIRDAEQVGRHTDRLRMHAAAELEHRSRKALGSEGLSSKYGYVRSIHLLERMTGISEAEATRRIRTGIALRTDTTLTGDVLPPRFEKLAQAVDAGEVNVEAAASILRHLGQAERSASMEDLVAAEEMLVDTARRDPVDFVAGIGRMLRDRLDPDGVRPREEEIRERREIRLGRERHGLTPINGALEPLSAALLKAAFDEAGAPNAVPRFLSDHDRMNGTETVVDDDGHEVTTIRDTRSREQRQHDVLSGLITAGVRNAGTEDGQLRSTASVTAVILLKDLENGTGAGWIDGMQEAISASTAEMLACDGGFRKAVLGDHGEVLALGRGSRGFTQAIKRSVLIRDGGCVADGCTSPPAWVDYHHVESFWEHGQRGNSDLDNAVPLCPVHHQDVHLGKWKVRMWNGVPQTQQPANIDPTQTWRTAGKSRLRLNFRDTG
jgi:hypothetical protein